MVLGKREGRALFGARPVTREEGINTSGTRSWAPEKDESRLEMSHKLRGGGFRDDYSTLGASSAISAAEQSPPSVV